MNLGLTSRSSRYKPTRVCAAELGVSAGTRSLVDGAAELARKKVKQAKGETRAEVEGYFWDKYERWKAFLRQAIDRKESVQCSL